MPEVASRYLFLRLRSNTSEEATENIWRAQGDTGRIDAGYRRILRAFSYDQGSRVLSAQYSALKMVNKELISLYRDIERMIVEKQRGNTWGGSVVVRLTADLQKDFPAMRGFSAQNLWYMRKFYTEYSDKPKLQPMVGEID